MKIVEEIKNLLEKLKKYKNVNNNPKTKIEEKDINLKKIKQLIKKIKVLRKKLK
jgi:hypothetical protein